MEKWKEVIGKTEKSYITVVSKYFSKYNICLNN